MTGAKGIAGQQMVTTNFSRAHASTHKFLAPALQVRCNTGEALVGQLFLPCSYVKTALDVRAKKKHISYHGVCALRTSFSWYLQFRIKADDDPLVPLTVHNLQTKDGT